MANKLYMTEQEYLEYLQSDWWKHISKERMKIDKYKCCMCGCTGSPSNRLQAHHINYYHIKEEDVWNDLITLCDCCHASVHKMMNRITSEDGRMGWTNKSIPTVHAYTFSGLETEYKHD